MNDSVLRATLDDGVCSVMIIRSGQLVERARAIHDLSPVAAAALGRLLTAGVLMALPMKAAGHSLTVWAKGGGALGRVLVVARPDGGVKGYVENPRLELPLKANGKLDVGGALGREGTLSVVRDSGTGEPYVGLSPLVSGEIGEDIAHYYAVSEQQPTLLSLGVLIGTDSRVRAAGGLLVQPLPGCPDAVLETLERLAPGFSDISLQLGEPIGLDALLERFFKGFAVRILESAEPRYACDCSRGRVERALISMGASELRDMIRQDGGAQVLCHFCGHAEQFSAGDLECLLRSAR